MKSVVERLAKANIIFKSLRPIAPQELGKKKQIEIYIGTQLNGYYALILGVERKSRIVRKNANDYVALHQQAQIYNDSKIYKKYILVNAPLCSKAKAILIEEGWRLFEINTKPFAKKPTANPPHST